MTGELCWIGDPQRCHNAQLYQPGPPPQFVNGVDAACVAIPHGLEDKWIATASQDKTVCIWERKGVFLTVGSII